MSDLIVIGGPNGAGKTTAVRRLLPSHLQSIREFVNADEIARGISPFNPDGAALPAARMMIERVRALVAAQESFALETTCAGGWACSSTPWCATAGYRISLIFLWLPSPQAALDRVARRVAEGGHNIPPDTVVRRYKAGIRNMCHRYLPMAELALIYDNSDTGPVLIADKHPGNGLAIRDEQRWQDIEEIAR